MKTTVLKSRTLLACIAVTLLVTGCGKSSPTAPEVAPRPERTSVMHTDVRFDYVKVIKDGDLIGDGDFEFRRGVNGDNVFTSKTLKTDDVWTINTRQTVDREGSTITVFFEASEWDKDLLGKDVRDPDMDKRTGIRTHTVAAGVGGQHSITLGNDVCKVQMFYTLITYHTLEFKNP